MLLFCDAYSFVNFFARRVVVFSCCLSSANFSHESKSIAAAAAIVAVAVTVSLVLRRVVARCCAVGAGDLNLLWCCCVLLTGLLTLSYYSLLRLLPSSMQASASAAELASLLLLPWSRRGCGCCWRRVGSCVAQPPTRAPCLCACVCVCEAASCKYFCIASTIRTHLEAMATPNVVPSHHLTFPFCPLRHPCSLSFSQAAALPAISNTTHMLLRF